METLNYKTFEEMLDGVAAKDKGRYYICACPSCNHNEAYISKKNLNFINCNRKNSCGVSTRVVVEDKNIINTMATIKEPEKKLTFVQKQEQQLILELFEYDKKIRDYYHDQPNEVVSFLYQNRGITPETLLKSNVDVLTTSTLQGVAKLAPNLLDKKYLETWAKNRNIIFGFKNPETSEFERLSVRTTNTNEKIKELQLVLNEKEAVTFTEFGIPSAEKIYIVESVIDGLSLLEVTDEPLKVIALSGVNGVNRLANHMINNSENFQGKEIVILLDNDKAGLEASERLMRLLNALDDGVIYNRTINYSNNEIKDLNQYLQEGKNAELLKLISSPDELLPKSSIEQNLLKKVESNLKISEEASFLKDGAEYFVYNDDRKGILHLDAEIFNTNEQEFLHNNLFQKLKLENETLLVTSIEWTELPHFIEHELMKYEFNEDGLFADVEEREVAIKDLYSDKFSDWMDEIAQNPLENLQINNSDNNIMYRTEPKIFFENLQQNNSINLIVDSTIMRTNSSEGIVFDIMPPIVMGEIKSGRDYIFKEETANDYIFFEKNDGGISERLAIPKMEFEKIKGELIFEQSGLNNKQKIEQSRDLTFINVKNDTFDLMYKIDDNLAKRNHENNSFSDYNGKINEETVIPYLKEFVAEFESFVTSDNVNVLNTRLQDYNKLLVDLYENVFRANKIPSAMIVGPGNFPAAKKEQQNERIHKLEKEIYSDDGKRARFIENTYDMYDPKRIEMKKEQQLAASVRAEKSGFKTIYKEITNNDELAGYGVDVESNRVYIKTNGKPSAEIRTMLKQAGLRWSPKNVRWQRQLTDNAIYSITNKLLKPLNIEHDFKGEKQLDENAVLNNSEATRVNELGNPEKETASVPALEENKISSTNKNSLTTVLNDFRETKNSDTAKKIYEEIDLGVKNALSNPKEYKNLLLYSSKLSDYSFRNQILLYLQMTPEQRSLPLVNSFSDWKKQNVAIKKGSRAMAIVAPRNFKAFERADGKVISVLKATEKEKLLIENGTIPTITKKGFSYSFSAFHVQNTNADIDAMIKREEIESTLTDEQKEWTFNYLKNAIEANGTLIVKRDLLLISGTAQASKNHKITLNTRNTLEENITTLLHEYVHDTLHFDKKLPSAEAELQAESIAYMLSKSLGLKNESSFDYLANWSSEKNTKQLGENMQKILDGYKVIREKLRIENMQKQQFQQKNQKILQKNTELNSAKGVDLVHELT